MGRSDDGSRNLVTISEWTNENRLKQWFLLSSNRPALAGILAVCVFGSLVLLGTIGPGSVRNLLTNDTIGARFQSMIIGIISVVSLALIIGQLTVAQENDPLDDMRRRMEGTVAFQKDAEDVMNVAVSPASPSVFLNALTEAARNRAEALDDTVADSPDQQLRGQVADYVSDLVENTEQMSTQLQRARFGTFDAHEAMLNFEYTRHIHAARRIRKNHVDSLSDDATDILDELEIVLIYFGAAREHFETTYFQWELVDLSRMLVYTGIPAVVIGAYMALLFDVNAVSGAVLGVDYRLLIVSAAFTITLLPFLLILVYVIRVLTAAKRTMMVGPFILWESSTSDNSDGRD